MGSLRFRIAVWCMWRGVIQAPEWGMYDLTQAFFFFVCTSRGVARTPYGSRMIRLNERWNMHRQFKFDKRNASVPQKEYGVNIPHTGRWHAVSVNMFILSHRTRMHRTRCLCDQAWLSDRNGMGLTFSNTSGVLTL